jgi:hypothetical protein
MYRHPEDDIIVLSRTVPKAQSIAALILCVESLTEAGFANAGISFFWNPWLGYLGGYQFLITLRKAREPRKSFLERAVARLKQSYADASTNAAARASRGRP